MPCHTRMRQIMQDLFWLLILLEFGILTVMSLEPGYLDFDNLPDTNFSCVGKVIGGYYADLETNCQMFHVCTIGQLEEPMDIRFLCLNGTVFDQETRVCERIDEVDCSKSEQFYSLNLELYGNTQPPIVEEETPTEVKRSSTTTTTTTTTTQRPSRPKSTSPPFYSTSVPPTTTRATKVITSHHFPVINSPDIRFNPEEINISLNPDSPPDISRSQIPISYHQQIYNSNNNNHKHTKVSVTTHTTVYKNDKPHRVPLLQSQVSSSQILLGPEDIENSKSDQNTPTPKSVVSYGLTHNQGSQHATPTEINYGFTYHQTEENVNYNTEIPPHPYQYQINIANLRPPSVQNHPYRSYTTSKRPHKVNFPAPTTYRSRSISENYNSERTEKPPRLQLPLPLLPTLPPLTFSSPAPFSLGRHIETKRYTNDHHQSPQRIIISASASVSDNSGRRLNYSLGTIGDSDFLDSSLGSYDDYKDEDIDIDPFYHDVPKIKSLRHKRDVLTHGDVIKNEQEAAELLNYLLDWYTERENKKKHDIVIPVSAEDITSINDELAPITQVESITTEKDSSEAADVDIIKSNLDTHDYSEPTTKANVDNENQIKNPGNIEVSSSVEEEISNRWRIYESRASTGRNRKPNSRRQPDKPTITSTDFNVHNKHIPIRSRQRSNKGFQLDVDNSHKTNVVINHLNSDSDKTSLASIATPKELHNQVNSTVEEFKQNRKIYANKYNLFTESYETQTSYKQTSNNSQNLGIQKVDATIGNIQNKKEYFTPTPTISTTTIRAHYITKFAESPINYTETISIASNKAFQDVDYDIDLNITTVPPINESLYAESSSYSHGDHHYELNSDDYSVEQKNEISHELKNKSTEYYYDYGSMEEYSDTDAEEKLIVSTTPVLETEDLQISTTTEEKVSDDYEEEFDNNNQEVKVEYSNKVIDPYENKHQHIGSKEISDNSYSKTEDLLKEMSMSEILKYNLEAETTTTTTTIDNLIDIYKETLNPEYQNTEPQTVTTVESSLESVTEIYDRHTVHTDYPLIEPFKTSLDTQKSKAKYITDLENRNNFLPQKRFNETYNNILNLTEKTKYKEDNNSKGEYITIPDYVDDNYEPLTYQKPDEVTKSEALLTSSDNNNFSSNLDYNNNLNNQTSNYSDEVTEYTTDNNVTEVSNILTTAEVTTLEIDVNLVDEHTTSINTESTIDETVTLFPSSTVAIDSEVTLPTITTDVSGTLVTLTEPGPLTNTTTATTIPNTKTTRYGSKKRKPYSSNHRFNPRRKSTNSRTRTNPRNHSKISDTSVSKPLKNNVTNDTAKFNNTEIIINYATTPTNINGKNYNIEIKHNVDDTTMKQLHSIVLTTANPLDQTETTIIPTLPTTAEAIASKDNKSEVPVTDAPLLKSVNPTRAKYTKIVFTTTPLSRVVRVELRKDIHGRRFTFNCFNKKTHKFYSDPRDCRLFHYCTAGYSKNQMVDMKFVCDLGTYFDDEKLICSKSKPARCL